MLAKLVGNGKAAASCAPYWETYCVPNAGVCGPNGHAKYRRYHNVYCETCCHEYIGCC